jgi:head-tail adaptor
MKSVAGPKRHRISIQRRTDTLDGFGEGTPAWINRVDRYAARVRDDSQREFTEALQVQSEKSLHVEIRDPRIEITTKDRVIWHKPTGDLTIDIKALLAGENLHGDITLICSEHSTE